MNICVYGASSDNIEKTYLSEAYALGEQMAKQGYGLVFGGGAHGVMGAAVRGVTDNGGESIGVAPTFFDKDDILFKNCTQFIFTENMRQRKEKMEQLSDAFIAAPGGIGTFEEFFEILTLAQLGRHEKPIAVLNTNGYYNDIKNLLHKAVRDGFMNSQTLNKCAFCENAAEALQYINEKLK